MSLMMFLAGFLKLGKELAELLLKLDRAKAIRNNEAAAYFEQLSAAMEKVVDGLRANEVPRISGHEMQTLIHAFALKTNSVFDDQASADLKAALAQAATTASTLDGWLLLNQPHTETDREEMLALIERIAGDCRALAGVLKSPA